MTTGADPTYVTARHETVLVGVSGSAASAAATRWAAAEAARRGARLHAVHVVEPGRTEEIPPHRDLRLDLDLARRTVPGRVGGWVFRAGIDVEVAVMSSPGTPSSSWPEKRPTPRSWSSVPRAPCAKAPFRPTSRSGVSARSPSWALLAT